jgi:hypothetical protein
MATQDDARLLVQLLQWGSQMGYDDAMRTIFSPDFDPETATMDNPAVGRVLGFLETVGTFVKQELLDAELVWDLIWVEGIWAKVGRHALAARVEANEPRLWENFEALVERTAKVGSH